MNILYITHCDPRATDFGSAQRSHLVWKALQRLGTVYTVYNVGPCEALMKDDESRIASWHLAPRSRLLRYAQVFFAQRASPAAWPFRNKAFIRRQMPWQGVKFDAVVVRYLCTAAYANAWQFGPLYVDIDDLPIESFETVCRPTHRAFSGHLWHFIVKIWQRMILKKCRATWIANPAQVDSVRRQVPCMALPNLALPPKPGYQVNGKQREQLMTVGLMSYPPNYQGVDWFVDQCWPAIHAHFPQMTYVVAGGGCPEDYRRKWSAVPGVRVLGFVQDLDALYEESLAAVTPILSGAGTCIKVMEAALHGRVVLATPFAVRGLSKDDLAQMSVHVFASTSKCVQQLKNLKSDLVADSTLQRIIMTTAVKMISFEKFVERIGQGVILCVQ